MYQCFQVVSVLVVSHDDVAFTVIARYIDHRITDGTFYFEDTAVFVCSPSPVVMLGEVLPVAVENIKGVFGDKIITAVMISDRLYVGYLSGIWSFQRNITDPVE